MLKYLIYSSFLSYLRLTVNKYTDNKTIIVLSYLFFCPLIIVAWAGKLVSGPVCLSFGLAGLFWIFAPHLVPADRPHISVVLLLFGVGIIAASSSISHYKQLKRSFISGKIELEVLLVAVGVLLWILALVSMAVYFIML